jgi:hypothetical protein
MMIFEGDFVKLHMVPTQLFKVVEILPFDICVLDNGFHVCASPEYIADYYSANEVMVVTNPDLVLDPTKPAYFVKQTTVSH